MDIEIYLREKRELIESYLKSYFIILPETFVLQKAMGYSLFAEGKRIRPILALASYEACGGDSKIIIPYASALELIHTYSLIHDDLPSMDNDDLRRGKPTNHKVFGEAIAILAGDALLTEAFLMMTNNPPSPSLITPSSILKAIREIALSAGIHGMVGGQALDMFSGISDQNRGTLAVIHLHKTAALLTASVRLGPILAESSEDELRALTKYGESIGLAFQIVDDILDIEGSTAELGKPTGSDERMKKLTYPSLYGIEASKIKAENLISEALNALKIFSSEADPLREIAHYLIKRRA